MNTTGHPPDTRVERPLGSLYLIPNLLGVVPPTSVLPEQTIAIARRLTHFVVETPKAARAFIKALGPERPLREIGWAELKTTMSVEEVENLLAPIFKGDDLGMVSDAGCPGVADPGATLVAAAHRAGIRIIPLVGPSAVLLALMASGMSGQQFAFNGYLPVPSEERAAALRRLEGESRSRACTQLFIETPYRNTAMLSALVTTLQPSTQLCVAVDLTLPSESIVSRPIDRWRGTDFSAYDKRPALFLLQA